jgi:hypothetical protein
MKKITLALLLAINLHTIAQEITEAKDTKKFTISGSVDAYFKTNLTGPNEAFTDENGENPFFLTPGTSFADRSGFSIGMANTIVSYEGDKVGFVADLVFGPRGEDAVFLSVGSANIVNQLYVYWNVSEKVTLTLGNFNTFLGYEVISPVANFNYSTSYMFSYGPFSHTGLKADFVISDDFSLMLTIMNSTDYTEINLDGSYTLGGQLEYKNQCLNVIYGDQTGTTGTMVQIDYTGGADLSDSFFLGVNATYIDTDGAGLYGVALYPQFQVSEAFAIGARGEYFAEMEGGTGAIGTYDSEGDANIFDITLTGSFVIKDLTIKPELRLDAASEDTFLDTDMIPTGSLSSFLVAAIYKY